MRNFMELLRAKWSEGKFVCVGLDSEVEKIPDSVSINLTAAEQVISGDNVLCAFNSRIISATKDLVCAYKPNIAFYEALGPDGIVALRQTIKRINVLAPDVPVILDYKRGDIGNTNLGYIKSAFEYFEADAVTVNPFLGQEALQPFLNMKDKGIIILCRTSNPGAGEFQDVPVHIRVEEFDYLQSRGSGACDFTSGGGGSTTMCNHVAYRVSQHWNVNGNCAVVVGATFPQQLSQIRSVVGDMPILLPGVGFQQKGVPLEAQIEQTVVAGQDSNSQGMIINSSRGIIFASSGVDFDDAARRETLKLHGLINKFRKVG